MTAKAILFDLDGTLIDSESLHFDSWNELLSTFSIRLEYDHYIKEYAGVSLPVNAEKLAQLYNLDITVPALVQERQRILLKRMETHQTRFMPHAMETVQFFHSKKIVLGLVTSSSRTEVDIVLKENGLGNYFSAVITRDDVTRHKPDPEPYTLAAASLGLLKSDYVVFEDSFSGVISAKAAGLLCYAVQYHEAERNKLKNHADGVFNDLKEAKNYLLNNRIVVA